MPSPAVKALRDSVTKLVQNIDLLSLQITNLGALPVESEVQSLATTVNNQADRIQAETDRIAAAITGA